MRFVQLARFAALSINVEQIEYHSCKYSLDHESFDEKWFPDRDLVKLFLYLLLLWTTEKLAQISSTSEPVEGKLLTIFGFNTFP